MPLVSALRAWLAMVNPKALAPDTRLEIAIVDGRLDVIETKKSEKVSQILTNEQYQPKIGECLARYIRTALPGWTVLFYNGEVSLLACDTLYSLPDMSSPACESCCFGCWRPGRAITAQYSSRP